MNKTEMLISQLKIAPIKLADAQNILGASSLFRAIKSGYIEKFTAENPDYFSKIKRGQNKICAFVRCGEKKYDPVKIKELAGKKAYATRAPRQTLRDLFAASALTGLISRANGNIGGRDQEMLFAEISYDFADAMLLKRPRS